MTCSGAVFRGRRPWGHRRPCACQGDPSRMKGKAAFRLVKLHRADAQIQHDTIDLFPGQPVGVGKRALDQPQPVAIFVPRAAAMAKRPTGRGRCR